MPDPGYSEPYLDMPDAPTPAPKEQTPGRVLVGTAGAIICEAGVQAMLTSQTQPLSVTVPVAAAGAILILIAMFWKRLRIDRTEFSQRLNLIAATPKTWIIVVASVWLYMATMNVTSEIRRNNEIVALRNDEQSMAKVIERLVLPRHLSKRQQSTMSNFLLQFSPHEFAFRLPNRNEEVGQYRVDIEQALLKGGWTRSDKNPYEYADDIQEGLSMNFIQTMEHAQKPNDPRNPRPDTLLQMALGLAGIRLNGSGGGSGVSITEDRLVISIGKRRMDSFELILPDSPF